MEHYTFITFIITMMVLNAIYSFLPTRLQRSRIIRFFAILAAVTILIWGIAQTIQGYKNRIYAHVSVNGEIIKSKNFPWDITISYKEGEIIYLLNERYGDATNVSIKMDNSTPKYKIYIAINGIAIKFFCEKQEISDFWIYVKNP